MNKRIQELAEQAGFDVKRLMEPYPGGFPREDMLALESFAELIVSECIGVLNRRYMGDNNREDMEVRRCVEDLKKHFVTKDENSKITDEEWYWAIK